MPLVNPPPAVCEGCNRRTRGPEGAGPAAGDPLSWIRLTGPDVDVSLIDGRVVHRRGAGWVCPVCAHTVPASREHARSSLEESPHGD